MAQRSMVMVKRTYLHIAIVSLVTAVIWTISSLYRTLTTTSQVEVNASIKQPINTTLNQAVFENIIAREDLTNLPFDPGLASESAVVINEIEGEKVEVATEPGMINPELIPDNNP